jgi:small-conductance mechanosensitive channel
MDTTALGAARAHLARALGALVALVAAMVVGRGWGRFGDRSGVPATTPEVIVASVAVVVVLVAGVLAVRALATAVRRAMEHEGNAQHSAPLSLVVSFVGYLAVAVCVLVLLRQPIGGLLLGGALTGVLLGIAAQQVLANFFAGLVLLIVRPFTITDEIVLKSGPLGGEYEGVVTDMGLFYVRLETRTGPVALPNAGVLASAVGPGVRATEEEDDNDQDEEVTPPARGGAP